MSNDDDLGGHGRRAFDCFFFVVHEPLLLHFGLAFKALFLLRQLESILILPVDVSLTKKKAPRETPERMRKASVTEPRPLDAAALPTL